MEEIKQLSSRVVYENRWMRVREDVIERAGGGKGLFGVVEKPDFVVVVPYENGKVHLVEQYRYPVGQRFWEFPQGSWETAADKSPEDVARGELKEETGLLADTLTYLGHQYLGYGYSQQGYHIFLATGLTYAQAEPEAEEEGLVSAVFDLSQLEEMITNGTIKDATTLCAYSLAQLKNAFRP